MIKTMPDREVKDQTTHLKEKEIIGEEGREVMVGSKSKGKENPVKKLQEEGRNEMRGKKSGEKRCLLEAARKEKEKRRPNASFFPLYASFSDNGFYVYVAIKLSPRPSNLYEISSL